MIKHVIIAISLTGCLSNTQKAEYAKKEYYNDMHNCVVNNNTKESIDACKAEVKREWGK